MHKCSTIGAQYENALFSPLTPSFLPPSIDLSNSVWYWSSCLFRRWPLQGSRHLPFHDKDGVLSSFDWAASCLHERRRLGGHLGRWSHLVEGYKVISYVTINSFTCNLHNVIVAVMVIILLCSLSSVYMYASYNILSPSSWNYYNEVHEPVFYCYYYNYNFFWVLPFFLLIVKFFV